MITVMPFRGLRPKKELASKIAALPYDVISSEEARIISKGDEYTFLHCDKPEIDLEPNVHLYDDRVYEKGKENFDKMIKNNWVIQDEKPCFYIYSQQMGNHKQYGIVVGASVEDYNANKIKKHEFTRKDKEADRTKHVATLNAHTGPGFLAYKNDNKTLDDIIKNKVKEMPEYDFTSPDNIRHTLWVISDEKTINTIKEEFKKMDCLYIADGHHRTASASNVAKMKKDSNPNHTGKEEYNFFLAVVFSAHQLYIMDYNRIIKDLHGHTPEQFIQKLQSDFDVQKTGNKKPKSKHEFCMYLGNEWYTVKAKKGTFDEKNPVKSLDVSILQDKVLTKLLDITDPRTDKRIDFVGGIRGVEELERRCKEDGYVLAFSMFPTSMDDLMNVADSNNIMPPKSTWFEPKLRSGVVMHLLD